MLNFEANKMSDMPDLMPGGELALDKRTAAADEATISRHHHDVRRRHVSHGTGHRRTPWTCHGQGESPRSGNRRGVHGQAERGGNLLRYRHIAGAICRGLG